MHHHLFPVHFAFLDLAPWSIAIIVPIFAMIFGGVMAGMGMYFHHQRQRLNHETARLALEKGQPVPDFSDDKKRYHTRSNGDSGRHDLRGGLILIGVGAGIYVFFVTVGAEEARFIGAIPGFIGVALLLHALLTALLPKKNPAPEDRSPQS